MPKFTIEILKGYTIEQKRNICRVICAEATKFFRVSPENILIRIDEIEEEDLFINGKRYNNDLSGVNQPNYARGAEVFVSVFYIEGRAIDVLRGFATRMTEKLKDAFGNSEINILLYFQEMKKGELSRGGVLLCDMP
jgi:phenylpyruvate tautomerase PptA (4-oxalocrotonate tautomerase family)